MENIKKVKAVRKYLMDLSDCGKSFCSDWCALSDQTLMDFYEYYVDKKEIEGVSDKDIEQVVINEDVSRYVSMVEMIGTPGSLTKLRRNLSQSKVITEDEMTLLSDAECIKLYEENNLK